MTCSNPISLCVTSDLLPRQCAEIDVRRHLEGRHRPDSAAHATPPYRPLHPRQQAFGLIPTSAPGAQTGLKHFTPLHEAGAVGAIFVAYLLGPFMATCLSTATTWSGAKHTGQHWPLFRLMVKGAKHWMSGHPHLGAGRADGLEALHALARGWRGRRHLRRVLARALHGDVPVHRNHVVRGEAHRAALALVPLDGEGREALDVWAPREEPAALALVIAPIRTRARVGLPDELGL